ncbi:hypothetical protein HDK90DRAFT_515505 [Phyllosticta capitalensis]|uniref:Uncharacterized protein n=1 Tax=Phyllosticta capitalensis TaxID=121624 RepID=A0ABR1Y9M5_9PEZI
MAADFVELSNELLSKVRDCEFLKTQELRRLHPILVQLRSENETLTTNLNTKAPTITPATLQILRKVPLKCFVTPAPGLFNEVMPRLADYKITFQDNFHGDQRFKEVINVFELFCKSEQALLQSFEAVKTLAKENQSLRTRHLLLSSGDQLAELEKSNGTLPCLNLFIRRVPFEVREELVPDNDTFHAYEEYTHHHKHTELVLEQLIQKSGYANVFYHPFSERYVPSLWADRVPSTAISWRKAESGRMYQWEGMVKVQEPGDAGGVRWFPPLPDGALWKY